MKKYIKLCGFTRDEDIYASINEGIDLIGLIHVPSSPRHLGLETITTFTHSIKCRGALSVLVVCESNGDKIRALHERTQCDFVQLHSNYTETTLESTKDLFRILVINTQNHRPEDMIEIIKKHSSRDRTLIVIESARLNPSQTKRIAANLSHYPILLAGGISASTLINEQSLIENHGIDACRSVETQPGIKCRKKIQTLARHFFNPRSPA